MWTWWQNQSCIYKKKEEATDANKAQHQGGNSSQGDPVTGKYAQLYSHTECYACHRYGIFPDQFPDKQPKSVNLAIIGVILM